MSGLILLDFDGTVAIEDTTDLLLERFAQPGWREIEREWEVQKIGSRECMARQVDLVRASESELAQFIASVRIDPSFVSFVETCQAAQFPVMIVSDGLDRIVEGVIARTGLNLPIAANRLEHLGDDRWRLGFPHANPTCSSEAGNCKCAHASSRRRGPFLVIGDGRSDFCAASGADYVFAKGRLAAYCEENGIAHAPISGLREAQLLFAAWHHHFMPAHAQLEAHVAASHG